MSRWLTDEELEARAKALRKRLGLEHQARLDMMTVITKLKVAHPGFDYSRVPDHEIGDAEAQWDSGRGVVRLAERVFRGIQA